MREEILYRYITGGKIMEFVIPVIDTLSLTIGINLGVAVGYWSYWFLFGRENKQKALLEVPPK